MVSSEPKPQRCEMRFTGSLRFREQPACRFDAQLLDGARGRDAGGLSIVTAEAAFAHAGAFGQHRQRNVVGEVLADPVMQRAEAVVRGLQRQCGAELRLAAGAFQKHHEMTCDGQRDARPRSSSTSASARSMPAVTPAEVQTSPSGRRSDRLRHARRKAARQFGAADQWRRGAPAVEQAGGRQQEGAGADRRGAPRLRAPLAHPGDHRGIGRRGMDAGPAGNQQRVERSFWRGESGCVADAESGRDGHGLPPCATTRGA